MKLLLFFLGSAMIIIGGICDLFGAIGLLRFPNFFVRLHSATVGTIGGAVIPLFGTALVALSYDYYPIAGASFITGIIVLLVAPAGTHALAYSAHKAKLIKWEKVCDHLGDDQK